MTLIHIATDFDYSVGRPTPFAFAITTARTPHQFVRSEELTIEPSVPHELVPYGTGTHQLVRLQAEPGELRVRYRATVDVTPELHDPSTLHEVAFGDLPAEVLPYLNPSRYCESDKVGELATREFGDLEPGWGRVKAISDWVEANLTYQAGVTDASSGTVDVLVHRAGVCRDFAHVGISLCRATGIPARYVSGYGVGVKPQDFHGFFEAFLDDEWYLFDPTGMAPSNGLVRIGYGRDAADAPFATFVGQAMLLTKRVEVSMTADPPEDPSATAASTA